MRRVLETIARHGADTVVLTETTADRHDELGAGLRTLGFGAPAGVAPADRARGVLIASKRPFERREPSATDRIPEHRWSEVWFPRERLGLAGVYFPDTAKPIAEFWPFVHQAALRRRDENFLLIGDLNSGQSILDTHGRDLGSDPWFTAMPFHGMFDLWRHRHRDRREYTWYAKNRGRRFGFRLDHAFGTAGVRRRLRNAWYSHGERTRRISDHSSLLVALR